MRRSLALASGILLFAAGCLRAAQAQDVAPPTPDAARALIARCADAQPTRVGLPALESACPGLGDALDVLGLKAALIEGADARIDGASLADLLTATRPAVRSAPDRAHLDAVLAGLRGGTAEAQSTWQRLKHWFESTFLSRRNSASIRWLTEWLDRLTPGKLARELLVWGLVIAVVGAAVVVIVRELRASDIRLMRLFRRRARPALTHGAPGPMADTVEGWRHLEPAQRPAALFRHVTQRLSAEGRLPARGSDTHRELRERAKLETSDEREAWRALAGAAERQIYAPQGVTEEEAVRSVSAASRHWADS